MEEELWMGAIERSRLIEVRKWMDGKQSASEGAERLGLTVRAFRYLAARVKERGDGAVIMFAHPVDEPDQHARTVRAEPYEQPLKRH